MSYIIYASYIRKYTTVCINIIEEDISKMTEQAITGNGDVMNMKLQAVKKMLFKAFEEPYLKLAFRHGSFLPQKYFDGFYLCQILISFLSAFFLYARISYAD